MVDVIELTRAAIIIMVVVVDSTATATATNHKRRRRTGMMDMCMMRMRLGMSMSGEIVIEHVGDVVGLLRCLDGFAERSDTSHCICSYDSYDRQ